MKKSKRNIEIIIYVLLPTTKSSLHHSVFKSLPKMRKNNISGVL